MKFKTKVKYNGKYYAAGEDVPMEEQNAVTPVAPTPEVPADETKAKAAKTKK